MSLSIGMLVGVGIGVLVVEIVRRKVSTGKSTSTRMFVRVKTEAPSAAERARACAAAEIEVRNTAERVEMLLAQGDSESAVAYLDLLHMISEREVMLRNQGHVDAAEFYMGFSRTLDRIEGRRGLGTWRFQAQTSKSSTAGALEKAMRPFGLSLLGFLGRDESLEQVVAEDTSNLTGLGVTHEEIATALEDALCGRNLNRFESRVVSCLRRVAGIKRASGPDYERGRYRKARGIPDLYHPQNLPNWSVNSLPAPGFGLRTGRLQVFMVLYMGKQDCPWGCKTEKLGARDFLILNRRIGEYITGGDLIIHLIREHHFFEGRETPYRTDPLRAVRVLEIAPHIDGQA